MSQAAHSVEFFTALEGAKLMSGDALTEVGGISTDSRNLRAGDLFLAVDGASHRGLDFVADALARGAAGVVYDAAESFDSEKLGGAVAIALPALKSRLGHIAQRFYGAPTAGLHVVGVTGTNGKSSVIHFIAQMLEAIGRPCGLIGTMGWGLNEHETTANTTPDVVSLQAMMATMRGQGATAVAMEVSSHALAQERVDAIEFDTAVYTNLSRDHLDYHGTMEAYAAEKAKLFQTPGLRRAVLNVDDAEVRRVLDKLPASVIVSTVSTRHSGAEFFPTAVEFHGDGIAATINTPLGAIAAQLPILGAFNLSNALLAIAAVCQCCKNLDELNRAVQALQPVRGRMQRIHQDGLPTVVVDYAHTPDGLENALLGVRQHCSGELWCVFGCGGDRDRGKRALMAAVAEQFADRLVVTSDNPRSEDPRQIVEDVLAGLSDTVGVIAKVERGEAIELAIAQAGADDCILLAGKGHEDYQILADKTIDFSDLEVATQCLQRRGGSA